MVFGGENETLIIRQQVVKMGDNFDQSILKHRVFKIVDYNSKVQKTGSTISHKFED
jgi:hypothetical protein